MVHSATAFVLVLCCERLGHLHHWLLRFLCGQPVFMHEWSGTLVRIVPGPLLTTLLFVLDAAFLALGAAGTTCPEQGGMKCEICFEGVQIPVWTH